MGNAAILRREIESSLAARIPAALSVTPRSVPELLPAGIAEVDTLLRGGFALGTLNEVVGPASSGRSTLVLSFLASVAKQHASAAYVDVSDTFDPFSAAATGVDLCRLLWVRAKGEQEQFRPADYTPRCYESIRGRRTKVWDFLDQALRATDLLLNTGGFRAIVLDMGDVPPEQARRVPLASWYRFRLQAEKSQAILLLVAQTPCTTSCASIVLHCGEASELWECAAGTSAHLPLLHGFRYRLRADHKRCPAQDFQSFKKKPVTAAGVSWKSTTLWAG